MQNLTESDSGLPERNLQSIREVLGTCHRLKRAILFGSRAMGRFRPGSDIDIALDGVELTHRDLLDLMTKIDDLNMPYYTDLVHIQRVENQDLLAHIARVGKTLYEQ